MGKLLVRCAISILLPLITAGAEHGCSLLLLGPTPAALCVMDGLCAKRSQHSQSELLHVVSSYQFKMTNKQSPGEKEKVSVWFPSSLVFKNNHETVIR